MAVRRRAVPTREAFEVAGLLGGGGLLGAHTLGLAGAAGLAEAAGALCGDGDGDGGRLAGAGGLGQAGVGRRRVYGGDGLPQFGVQLEDLEQTSPIRAPPTRPTSSGASRAAHGGGSWQPVQVRGVWSPWVSLGDRLLPSPP